jgi:Tol biopolymer transport system component
MLKSDGLRRATTTAAGLVLAAALAVVVLLWGEGPAEAAFPGANGKIAFARNVIRSSPAYSVDIFKMNPGGSNATRLTDNPLPDDEPAWRPDGQKIAFTGVRETRSCSWDEEVYIMDPDGDRLTRLTHNASSDDFSPAWSPDGQKIAFASYQEGDLDIYVVDTDPSTNDAINVTNNTSRADFDPDWSPSGGKITFVSYEFEIGKGPQAIFVMNKDGSGQKRLTNNRLEDYSPDWQPIVP